jgi:PEP-CTERM motif-containing protein
MTIRVLLLCALLTPAWTLTSSAATILTFEPSAFTDTGIQLPADYGSRALTTPNIELLWSTGTTQSWCPWPSGYGDFVNNTYGCGGFNGPFTVAFTADPGWDVVVESFQVAGWPNTSRVITQIQVGTQTFNNVFAPGTGHNTLTPNEAGPRVLLSITGPDFFNAGLDNLRFSQVPVDVTAVPEPGTLALFGVGMTALGAYRRRVGKS